MCGHVFVSTDNSTVIIVIKGTFAIWSVGDDGPTAAKDKLNDNLLFSCRCAHVGPIWYQGVQDAWLVTEEGRLYLIGLNLYNNILYMYPNANI